MIEIIDWPLAATNGVAFFLALCAFGILRWVIHQVFGSPYKANQNSTILRKKREMVFDYGEPAYGAHLNRSTLRNQAGRWPTGREAGTSLSVTDGPAVQSSNLQKAGGRQ